MNTNDVKVTVIMPSLNVCPYIRQCLGSVCNQTLNDIEILCIDGGSTDGTLEVLHEFADKDKRIQLIHSEKKSYGYQINCGIERSHGTYIAIVETDDYISPDMLEALYSAAEKNGFSDIIASGYYSIWNESSELEKTLKITEEPFEGFRLSDHYELLDGHPSVWSSIYRKEFLDKKHIRMKEVPGAGWVDNPWLYQTLCEAEQICWVNEAFYYYRRNAPGSSSILKDCSVPIARLNEMLDYVESTHPMDATLKEKLTERTFTYFRIIMRNPNLTSDNRRAMIRLLRRYSAGSIYKEVMRRIIRKIRKVHSKAE